MVQILGAGQTDRVVLRTPKSLRKELSLIRERYRVSRGLHMIHASDDLVFANSRRLVEVCNALIDSRVRLPMCIGANWSHANMDRAEAERGVIPLKRLVQQSVESAYPIPRGVLWLSRAFPPPGSDLIAAVSHSFWW